MLKYWYCVMYLSSRAFKFFFLFQTCVDAQANVDLKRRQIGRVTWLVTLTPPFMSNFAHKNPSSLQPQDTYVMMYVHMVHENFDSFLRLRAALYGLLLLSLLLLSSGFNEDVKILFCILKFSNITMFHT